MNSEQIVFTLLFLGLMCILILAPFYPTWKEWKSPTDIDPMPLEDTPASVTTTVTTNIYLVEGSVFQQLSAPTIHFGQPFIQDTRVKVGDIRGLAPVYSALDMTRLPGAQVWGRGWRVVGDCHIPEGSELTGPLIVTGHLFVGASSLIHGDIMAHRDIRVEPACSLKGSMFCDGSIHLGPRTQVHGPIIAGQHLNVEAGAQLGELGHPTSVIANTLQFDSGVVAHGTVWARSRGCIGTEHPQGLSV